MFKNGSTLKTSPQQHPTFSHTSFFIHESITLFTRSIHSLKANEICNLNFQSPSVFGMITLRLLSVSGSDGVAGKKKKKSIPLKLFKNLHLSSFPPIQQKNSHLQCAAFLKLLPFRNNENLPPPTPLKILTCPHSPSRTHRWKHTCSNNESAWNSSRQAGGSGRHDGFCEAQQTVGKKKITQGLQKLQRRQKQEKHMWWRRTEGRRMLGSCWTPGFWCSKILERWRLTLPANVHHVFSFLKDLDWRFTNKEHSLFLCSQIGYKLFPSQQNLNSKISHWGCSCSSNFKSHQPERPLTFTFMRS